MTFNFIKSIDPLADVHLLPDPTFSLKCESKWINQAEVELPKAPNGKKLVLLHLPNTKQVSKLITWLKEEDFYPVSIIGKLPGVHWAVH